LPKAARFRYIVFARRSADVANDVDRPPTRAE
jgi:hypothetical protein